MVIQKALAADHEVVLAETIRRDHATRLAKQAVEEEFDVVVVLGGDGRYFLFHAGMGFDAAVVAEVEKRGRLKRYASHALFVYAAVDTWLRHYDRKRPAFRLKHSDGSVIPNSKFAICLNTDPYTYLGSRSLKLSSDAGLDQELVTISINSLSVNRMLGLVSAAIRGSTAFHNYSYIDYKSGVSSFKGYV